MTIKKSITRLTAFSPFVESELATPGKDAALRFNPLEEHPTAKAWALYKEDGAPCTLQTWVLEDEEYRVGQDWRRAMSASKP